MTLSPFKCLFSKLTYSLAAACIPCWGPSSSGLPRDVFPPTVCACDTLGCSNASHRTSRSAPEKETCSGEKENSKYLSYIFITNRFSIVFGYRGDADFGSCHIVILRKWAQDKEIITISSDYIRLVPSDFKTFRCATTLNQNHSYTKSFDLRVTDIS